MNHEILAMSKPHSWGWLQNHSYSNPVQELKNRGMGYIATLPYFFEQCGARNYDKKKVVINCGSFVRVINHTKDWDRAGCPDFTLVDTKEVIHLAA